MCKLRYKYSHAASRHPAGKIKMKRLVSAGVVKNRRRRLRMDCDFWLYKPYELMVISGKMNDWISKSTYWVRRLHWSCLLPHWKNMSQNTGYLNLLLTNSCKRSESKIRETAQRLENYSHGIRRVATNLRVHFWNHFQNRTIHIKIVRGFKQLCHLRMSKPTALWAGAIYVD